MLYLLRWLRLVAEPAPLRPFLLLRVLLLLLRLPPFKGIGVGQPMPPGNDHQTWLFCDASISTLGC